MPLKTGKGSTEAVSPETKKKIFQLIKGGYYLENIRERFGLAQETISKLKKEVEAAEENSLRSYEVRQRQTTD